MNFGICLGTGCAERRPQLSSVMPLVQKMIEFKDTEVAVLERSTIISHLDVLIIKCLLSSNKKKTCRNISHREIIRTEHLTPLNTYLLHIGYNQIVKQFHCQGHRTDASLATNC